MRFEIKLCVYVVWASKARTNRISGPQIIWLWFNIICHLPHRYVNVSGGYQVILFHPWCLDWWSRVTVFLHLSSVLIYTLSALVTAIFQVFSLKLFHYLQEVLLSIWQQYVFGVRLPIKSKFTASWEKWWLIGALGWVLSEDTELLLDENVLFTIQTTLQCCAEASRCTTHVSASDKNITWCIFK